MTKRTKTFDNAKIYKLIDTDGYYYIGSTCTTLTKRLYYHKRDATQQPERKVYKHFNEVSWDNVRIILLTDEVPIENNDQLLRLEDEYIQASRDDPMCLNTYHRAKMEKSERMEYQKEFARQYRIDAKELISSQRHKQYEMRKDKISQARKVKVNCPHCNKELTRRCLSRHVKTQHANTI
jgi:hypothetical protein